jgi:hypothetical protein
MLQVVHARIDAINHPLTQTAHLRPISCPALNVHTDRISMSVMTRVSSKWSDRSIEGELEWTDHDWLARW